MPRDKISNFFSSIRNETLSGTDLCTLFLNLECHSRVSSASNANIHTDEERKSC